MKNNLKDILKNFINQNKLNILDVDDSTGIRIPLNTESYEKQKENKCSIKELSKYIFNLITSVYLTENPSIKFLDMSGTIEIEDKDNFIDIEINKLTKPDYKIPERISVLNITYGKFFKIVHNSNYVYTPDHIETNINISINDYIQALQTVKQKIKKLSKETVAWYLLNGIDLDNVIDSAINRYN